MQDLNNIRALLDLLCQNVGGDWLLLGGSLVVLEFNGTRATEDIDLVPISHLEHTQVKMMSQLFLEIKKLNLSPSQVNAAAEYFVKQVPNWKLELVLIKKGTVGSVFRPSISLFVYLKLTRGSPLDIEDIQQALRSCTQELLDTKKIRGWASDEVWQRFLQLRL